MAHSVNSPQRQSTRNVKTTKTRAASTPNRPCSQCQNPVPIYQVRKMCTECRERCRAISLKRKKRFKEVNGMFSVFRVDLNSGTTESQTGTKRPTGNRDDDVDVNREELDEVVKRPRKEYELESADQAIGCDERSTEIICEDRDHQMLALISASEPIEYQTSSELYNSLPSQLSSFHACYTIVSTASPSISLTQRVQLVSHELRKELHKVGVDFNPYYPLQQKIAALTSSRTFACHIFFPLPLSISTGPSTSTFTMTTTTDSDSDPNPNLTQSELSRYFRHISTQSSASIAGLFGSAKKDDSRYSGGGGGGIVTITVEDDFSHPWGIRGHHIIIRIDLQVPGA